MIDAIVLIMEGYQQVGGVCARMITFAFTTCLPLRSDIQMMLSNLLANISYMLDSWICIMLPVPWQPAPLI